MKSIALLMLLSLSCASEQQNTDAYDTQEQEVSIVSVYYDNLNNVASPVFTWDFDECQRLDLWSRGGFEMTPVEDETAGCLAKLSLQPGYGESSLAVYYPEIVGNGFAVSFKLKPVCDHEPMKLWIGLSSSNGDEPGSDTTLAWKEGFQLTDSQGETEFSFVGKYIPSWEDLSYDIVFSSQEDIDPFKWHNYALVVDLVNDKLTLWIDDVKVTQATASQELAGHMAGIFFHCQCGLDFTDENTDLELLIDNVSVYSLNESQLQE